VGIAGVSAEVVARFYGEQYAPGVGALKILALATIFVFLNYPIGALFNACDRQKMNVVLYGATMCVNAILNFILIPRYAYVGAACAFFASHAILFGASFLLARRITDYSFFTFFTHAAKVIVSAIAMLAVVFVLKTRIDVFVVIAISAIVYFAVLYVLRGFSEDQINFLRKLFIRGKDSGNVSSNDVGKI
jgi:O-antigen/teichoic acid export membrane protein